MTDDRVSTVAAGVGLAIVAHPLLLLAFRDEFAVRAWGARTMEMTPPGPGAPW